MNGMEERNTMEPPSTRSRTKKGVWRKTSKNWKNAEKKNEQSLKTGTSGEEGKASLVHLGPSLAGRCQGFRSALGGERSAHRDVVGLWTFRKLLMGITDLC